jgi:hypothetical protein
MNEARPRESRSDLSDRMDRLGILALFRSDRINPRSDLAAAPALSGPTGPTGAFECRTGNTTSNQHGPTGPTENRDGATPAPELIRDLLEERAAIREHLGGQTRAEAEAGALSDVARSTGVVTARLSRLWIIDRGRR